MLCLKKSSAFVVNKNSKCYKCNRPGHFQSECIQSKSSENNNKLIKKCYFCKKMGHVKSECWFMRMMRNREKDSRKSNAFIVDSGASQHMCRDRHHFRTFSTLTNKFVIVGNSSEICALSRGKIVLQVYNGFEWVDTTIHTPCTLCAGIKNKLIFCQMRNQVRLFCENEQ